MKNQPRKKENLSGTADGSNFERINPNAAGIDIGSREHWVCVPADRAEVNVRRNGSYTPDLMAMAEWLKRV